MAERNEADALFATKRKKQQEEQAEQERREEMSRKKAEMEAEIRRLEEEAKRQKEQQEEARRRAEEEARRASEEAKEAEARAARAEEMAKQAQLKQEEIRREEERRAREKKEAEERRAREKKEEEERRTREKKEEEKRARERAAQEKAQAKRQEAQKAENRKREASEKKMVKERKIADIQPGKKLPVLPLAIGGAAAGVVVIVVICLVLFMGGKKGGVFESNGTCLASYQVLGYDVYYPDTFEERIGDGGVKLIHGSVEEGDGSFVSIFGETGENMEAEIGSTDPSEILRVFLESFYGVSDVEIYEMTTDSGQTVYCTDYFAQDIIYAMDYTEEEEAMGEIAMMILPLEDEYLFAMYGTMKDSYTEPLEEAVAGILCSIY